ncbi:MAG: methylglyoxal synthase [Bacteroidales bacterium]|nr:methylglyoxal synthase [Bacteroidales bacterium]
MKIALVAHDARKQELIEWVKFNRQELSKHTLYATGKLIATVELPTDETTADGATHLEVIRLLSGPLGGDQQIGAMIAEGKIDCLIFFCDNLITQGHQQDVGALSRLASLYNIAFATNRTTADMILTSPLWKDADYQPILPECINNYKNRKLQ